MNPTIHVLDVPRWMLPSRAPFRYPPGSKDYGVEQDFLWFLRHRYSAIEADPALADWLYLPVYWTRYHLRHDFGREGQEVLQDGIDEIVSGKQRVFTVCQYDDGPLADLGPSAVFQSSRKDPKGFDAPLLSSALPRTLISPKREHLACFAGRLSTHEIRAEALTPLRSHANVRIVSDHLTRREFHRLLRSSLICLAPRGYGGSSFRFFEGLQSGCVPWLIGEHDTRPFKDQIPWDSMSFYSETADSFLRAFAQLSIEEVLVKADFISKHPQFVLSLGMWQAFLINELKHLSAQHRAAG